MSSAPSKDPLRDLAETIYIALAARVFGTLAGTDQRKPEPKALAAYSFKLAEAFHEAYRETPRVRAALEAAKKANIKLDEVDISGLFQSLTKKA
jgi:arginyl-tRNA synthetase